MASHDVMSREPEESAPTAPGAFRFHPLRGPFNALFFTPLDRYLVTSATAQTVPLRRPATTVVELGPGVVANLRYLRAGTR